MIADPKGDLKLFNKKLAHFRHEYTSYDKHLDLMYDSEGNPTKLRKDINRVLYKIVAGELDGSWFKWIDNEIKNVIVSNSKNEKKEKKRLEHIGKIEKERKPKLKSIAQQQEALWRGVKAMQEGKILTSLQRKYLTKIGMRPRQLLRLHRKALPYYGDSE